jgi:hypothetical protein
MLLNSLNNFLITNLIDQHHFLDSFLLCDSYIELFKWDGSEGVVEEEESFIRLYSKDSSNVKVVRKSSAQSHYPYLILALLHLSNCPCHESFKDRSS